jgi:translocation and assembly module TamA
MGKKCLTAYGFRQAGSITVLLCILFLQVVFAQTPVVSIQYSEKALPDKQHQQLRRQLQTADTTLAKKRLNRFIENLREAGFAESSVDHYEHKQDSIGLHLFLGPFYQLEKLELVNLSDEAEQYLRKTDLPRPFSRKNITTQLESILYGYQAKGYPFAAFSAPENTIRQIGQDSVGISQRYVFDHGDLVKIDSINLRGKLREPEKLIYQLIHVKPGDYYRQNYIDQIPRLLDNTPYFERTSPPAIRFLPTGNAVLDLRLKRQRAGKFDLLLGLLPPDDPNQSRLRITGLVDAVFVSALEMGETIEFNYRQISAGSQILKLGYEQPHPGGLPVSPAFFFNLQKQEERFLNRSLGLSLRYAFSGQVQGELFYRNRQTALLDTTLARGPGGTALPEVMSGADRRFGLRFVFEKLDYRLNPRKGFAGFVEGGTGQRSTQPDIRLGDEARAVLEETQTVQEIETQISYFVPVGKRMTIRLANQTYLLAQAQYFQNDQRQLGGGRSVRGFEDNRFFSDRFTFFTAEYRLLLDRDAHMLAFTDYAYMENRVDNSILRPFSFGLGLQINTGSAGLLSLTYGIGQLGDGAFRPARGKLHIGLVNNF